MISCCSEHQGEIVHRPLPPFGTMAPLSLIHTVCSRVAPACLLSDPQLWYHSVCVQVTLSLLNNATVNVRNVQTCEEFGEFI